MPKRPADSTTSTAAGSDPFGLLRGVITHSYDRQSARFHLCPTPGKYQEAEEAWLDGKRQCEEICGEQFQRLRSWLGRAVDGPISGRLFDLIRDAEQAVNALVTNNPSVEHIYGARNVSDDGTETPVLPLRGANELRDGLKKLWALANSAIAELERNAAFAQIGLREWERSRAAAGSGDDQVGRPDNVRRKAAVDELHLETSKDKYNPRKLTSDEARRLAVRFESASDDYPDLSALVWFNLTLDVPVGTRSESGGHLEVTPPMFEISGKQGAFRRYSCNDKWWAVQLFTSDHDDVRFNRACKLFESLASQAGVPDTVGRPRPADTCLLTLLADADEVEKFGRHPTDPYLWANPSGKHIHVACPSWDSPDAVRQPACPESGRSANVGAPVPPLEAVRNGFHPEWWCAHLPNLFLRAAKWLQGPKQSDAAAKNETVPSPQTWQQGVPKEWSDLYEALTSVQPTSLAALTTWVRRAIQCVQTQPLNAPTECADQLVNQGYKLALDFGAPAEVLSSVRVPRPLDYGKRIGRELLETVNGFPDALHRLETLYSWAASPPQLHGTSPGNGKHAVRQRVEEGKKKPGKLKVPTKHRDALNRYLKWKKTCGGRPMIKKFWKEVMAKLPANKFKTTDQERDDFQEWYQNNYKN